MSKKMKRQSVYILTSVMPKTDRSGKKWSYLKDKDGSFGCHCERVGVFSSVKKAEDAMKKLIESNRICNEHWNSWETYFGFELDESYVDDAIFGECNVAHFESSRTYDSDGNLLCFSDLDWRCEKKFNGRKDPVVGVKKGDVALFHSGSKILPVLIGELAMSKDEWKNRFDKNVYGDVTDDSGVGFFGDGGHEHPFSSNLFPISCMPHVKIDKDIVKKMKRDWKEYYGKPYKKGKK